MYSSTPNDVTIDAYNKKVINYLESTPQSYLATHGPLLRWIQTSLSFIPKDGHVLEIGSGTGREARFIRSCGYKVTCSDASTGFVEYLNKNGEDAQFFNILKDELKNPCDMLFANAVMPHFTKSDVETALTKAKKCLKKQGVFAFSLKQGHGNEWISEKFNQPRFIQYWQPDEIKELVTRHGFKILFIESDIPGDLPSHTWTNITIQVL